MGLSTRSTSGERTQDFTGVGIQEELSHISAEVRITVHGFSDWFQANYS